MIQFSITLTTTKKLEKAAIKQWYQTVVEHAPEGITISLHRDGEKASALIAKHSGSSFHYTVPLTRHLSEEEGKKIVDAYATEHPDDDFDITTTTNDISGGEEIAIDKSDYLDLCTRWAKRQHEGWVKERLENGWRYGPTFSLTNKTNPLLRPWHDLPDKFKKIDHDQPNDLLALLNDQGYTVISQNELKSLLSLMRNCV